MQEISFYERQPALGPAAAVRLRFAILSSILVSLLYVAGCAGVATTAPPDQSANPPASGPLTASAASLTFGDVIVGNSQVQKVTLHNKGKAKLDVSQAALTGRGFTTSGVGSSLILTPNQAAVLIVRFAPTIAGRVTGSITLSNSASSAPLTIMLTGNGVQPTGHYVTLTWDPSASGIAGYNVYRGTHSGGPYTRLNSSVNHATTYTDTTVNNGKTYFYVVTSVSVSNGESPYSTPVSAAIPSS
jgi:Cep192 domain 4